MSEIELAVSLPLAVCQVTLCRIETSVDSITNYNDMVLQLNNYLNTYQPVIVHFIKKLAPT